MPRNEDASIKRPKKRRKKEALPVDALVDNGVEHLMEL